MKSNQGTDTGTGTGTGVDPVFCFDVLISFLFKFLFHFGFVQDLIEDQNSKVIYLIFFIDALALKARFKSVSSSLFRYMSNLKEWKRKRLSQKFISDSWEELNFILSTKSIQFTFDCFW